MYLGSSVPKKKKSKLDWVPDELVINKDIGTDSVGCLDRHTP